jgi:hypothetical protein
MPRYYVRLEPQRIRDEEGEELPEPDVARRLARSVAADLIRNSENELPYQRLVISDVTGAVICETPLVLH